MQVLRKCIAKVNVLQVWTLRLFSLGKWETYSYYNIIIVGEELHEKKSSDSF